MSYRDINLLPAYETGVNDLIEEFYIPVLEKAKRYDRIAGFFSSSSLALSARGIAGLIANQGKMRLITCPRLESSDFEIIKNTIIDENIIAQSMCREIDSIVDDFQKDHVAALGWLLEQKILEIKIAFVYENGKLVNDENALSKSIMHQKVGVLYDEEYNGISFSGSNNESASGWLNNIEEFKVFCSWNDGQKPYFESDREKFERLWTGKHPAVIIKNLPEAVSEKLIEISKDFHVDRISSKRYSSKRLLPKIAKPAKEELKLFFYQKDAVEKWNANGRSLLLEMATGCGKTRTAIGCMKTVLEEHIKPLLIIVACPGDTLSVQWKTDIEKLEVSIQKSVICDGTNSKWKNDLDVLLKQLATKMYDNAIVYTTHKTCSSKEFIAMIKRYSVKLKTLFIGDEVHGMGAYKSKQGLLEEYEMRLGLSATPSRWFDESGTKLIQTYFGDDSFEFSIESALNTINPITGKPFLVNYHYHPRFIHLTDEELEKYKKLSDRIIKMSGSKKEEMQKILENLLFQRANIEKSAENKYSELESILNEIGPEIEDTIIFVSPEQIEKVLIMLAKRKVSAHSFTEAESSKPSAQFGGLSERDFIIKQFKQKNYKVLVAIKCLDEGIDIPSAKRAIIMASSTNPREYVQRIGRVIRQAENKPNADIYDMIIKPDLSNSFSEEFRKMEQRIFQKEMDRVLDLSKNSLDNASVVNLVYKIKGEFKK